MTVHHFIQMQPGGATVNFTGDHARLYDQSGAPLTPWTYGGKITGVSPGVDVLTTVDADGTHHSSTIAIGMLVEMDGQSNISNWFADNTQHAAVAAGYLLQPNGTWSGVPGSAAREFVETLSDTLGGVPVGIINASLGATSLLQSDAGPAGWWDNGPCQASADALVALNFGEIPGVVIFGDGERDANKNASAATWQSALSDEFSYIATTRPGAHIFELELGHDPDNPGGVLEWDAIRAAEHNVTDADAFDYVSMGALTTDIDNPTIHFTTLQNMTIADRMAASVIDWGGWL